MDFTGKRILITGGSGFIGTNLIEFFEGLRANIINIDTNAPLDLQQQKYWKVCDIMDEERLMIIFRAFAPQMVVHLAARTDTDIYDLEADIKEYEQNTTGTLNVLNCIKKCVSIERVIITSSMFVCKAGYSPQHDHDFNPYTLYGVSKVITEKYTHAASLACTWTIIRPQTIWGPWCFRYVNGLFRIIERGLYVHPNRKDTHRAYGYVGNVVWQIGKILSAPHEFIHQKVLYVGDQPVNIVDWVNTIALELTGKKVRLVPPVFVRQLALMGDLLLKRNIRFPITSTRYASMVQDYNTPIEKTILTLGSAPYSMEEGVSEFINWYKNGNSEVRNQPVNKSLVLKTA